MAGSGSFTGTTANSAIVPTITWSAAQSQEGNYSDVTAVLTYDRTNSGYTTYGTWSGSITINGAATAGSRYLEIGYQTHTEAIRATVRVYHETDGSRSVTISAAGGISGTSPVLDGNCGVGDAQHDPARVGAQLRDVHARCGGGDHGAGGERELPPHDPLRARVEKRGDRRQDVGTKRQLDDAAGVGGGAAREHGRGGNTDGGDVSGEHAHRKSVVCLHGLCAGECEAVGDADGLGGERGRGGGLGCLHPGTEQPFVSGGGDRRLRRGGADVPGELLGSVGGRTERNGRPGGAQRQPEGNGGGDGRSRPLCDAHRARRWRCWTTISRCWRRSRSDDAARTGRCRRTGRMCAFFARRGARRAGGHNALTLRARYRRVGGSWGAYQSLTSGTASVLAGFETTGSYEVQLTASDSLGGSKTVLVPVSTAEVTLHLRSGGKGAAFGKYSEKEALECAWNAEFQGEVQAASLRVGGRMLLDWIYPIGAVYISASATDPKTLFGGTWTPDQGPLSACCGRHLRRGKDRR